MRERPKPGFSMIVADTAVTNATERQLAIRDMHERVVDATAAEGYFAEHFVLGGLILGKEIERQGLWAPLDLCDHVAEVIVGHHGQYGAKDLLLHGPVVPRDVLHDGRLDEPIPDAVATTDNDLARVDQGDNPRGIPLVDDMHIVTVFQLVVRVLDFVADLL